MEPFAVYKDIQARTKGQFLLGGGRTGPDGQIHIYPAVHGTSGTSGNGRTGCCGGAGSAAGFRFRKNQDYNQVEPKV